MRLPTGSRGYSSSLLAGAVAALVPLLLRPYLLHNRGALFLGAIAVSAQYGLGTGLLALVIGILAIDLIFLEPSGPTFAYPDSAFFLVEFAAVGVLILVLSASLRAARRQAESSLALLDTLQTRSPVGFGFVDQNLKLTRVNQALAELLKARVVADITPLEERPALWPTIEPLVRQVLASGESITNLLPNLICRQCERCAGRSSPTKSS